jgi:hypothetical protein
VRIRNLLARETGKAVLWLVLMIILGITVGWFWAFLACALCWLFSLAAINIAAAKILGADNDADEWVDDFLKREK